jgi:hypothetical protein
MQLWNKYSCIRQTKRLPFRSFVKLSICCPLFEYSVQCIVSSYTLRSSRSYRYQCFFRCAIITLWSGSDFCTVFLSPLRACLSVGSSVRLSVCLSVRRWGNDHRRRSPTSDKGVTATLPWPPLQSLEWIGFLDGTDVQTTKARDTCGRNSLECQNFPC